MTMNPIAVGDLCRYSSYYHEIRLWDITDPQKYQYLSTEVPFVFLGIREPKGSQFKDGVEELISAENLKVNKRFDCYIKLLTIDGVIGEAYMEYFKIQKYEPPTT